MLNINKKDRAHEVNLYNNILSLSRNKLFYTEFNLKDTFHNRVHLIFMHSSFLFNKIRQDRAKNIYDLFYQKTFKNIELNMREIGYGDTMVNKNMKTLVKIFYDILLNCENFKNKTLGSKNVFFQKYLQMQDVQKMANNLPLINYCGPVGGKQGKTLINYFVFWRDNRRNK